MNKQLKADLSDLYRYKKKIIIKNNNNNNNKPQIKQLEDNITRNDKKKNYAARFHPTQSPLSSVLGMTSLIFEKRDLFAS